MIALGRFDLVSLRLFAAVVDAGSLTAGAARFGISLAAASKRVAELEGDLDTAWLTRGKAGVTPTPAGLTLYQHAVKLVADLEQLAVAMGDYGHGVRGHLRLWVNTSAVNGRLPAMLASFVARHPGIKVDIEETLSDAIVRALATGAADLGVFGENTACAGLRTAEFDVDRLVVLAPDGHPLARRRRVRFAQALAHDFVGLDRSTSLLRLMSAAAQAEAMPLKVRVQVRSFDAMCRMAAHGLGVCVLPRSAASALLAPLGLREITLSEPWATRRLLIGWRDDERLSPPARALLAMVAEGR